MKAYVTIYRTPSGRLYTGGVYELRENAESATIGAGRQFVCIAENEVPSASA